MNEILAMHTTLVHNCLKLNLYSDHHFRSTKSALIAQKRSTDKLFEELTVVMYDLPEAVPSSR